jgi:hypothetical protein
MNAADTVVTLPALGSLIAGSAFTMIAVALILYRWKLMLAPIRGKEAIGQVVRFDPGKAANLHPCIAFTASNGQEIEYREPFKIPVKVGDSRTVRYYESNPYCATSYPPQKLMFQVCAFFVLFAAGGGVTLAGAIRSLLANGDRFDQLSGAGLCFVLGCISAYVSITSFGKTQSWHRRIRTTGKVKRVQARPGGDKQYPNPWISYVTRDGRSVEYLDTQVTGYGPGEEISVYYDPEYPEFSSTGVDRAGYTGQALLFGLSGVLFLGLSGWFAWLSLTGS